MAAADWLKMRTEYVTTDISYRKLAAKYGVSFNTLKGVAGREQWVQLREQARNKIATKAINKEADRTAARYTKLLSVTDLLLEKIEHAVRALDDPEILGLVPKASLRGISGALKDIQEIQGLRTELDTKEQKARIKKLEREAEGETDSTITLRLSEDLKKYAE